MFMLKWKMALVLMEVSVDMTYWGELLSGVSEGKAV
ncbi:Uncharacterized protein TXXE_06195 [Thermobacillus xylanilyticus]|jgi:hypothetical protein|uniref:Uncharacterized protein n=2 Tax=Thermobacillus TaxID=76632 RepID=L0EIA7_THECK|nr:hypothetical protein Theco_3373 [Thermobacillus composti KWC4]CAG5082645.1 Uncharacterized protein TXXE_06195 [Thermobacillus xylanilyticus]